MVLPVLAPLAPLAPVLTGGAAAGGSGAATAAGGIAVGQVLRTAAIAASGISLANPVGIAIVAGSIAAPIVVSKGVAALQAAGVAASAPPPPPPSFFFLAGQELTWEEMKTLLEVVRKVVDTYENSEEAKEKGEDALSYILKKEVEDHMCGKLKQLTLDPRFLNTCVNAAKDKNIINEGVEAFANRLIQTFA